MSKSKANILVQNTKWIYITKIVSQLLGLIASVLVIRKLDVDIFGTYSLLLNFFILFQIFALSAVTNLFNRYIPELIENKEFRKFKQFIKKGFFYSGFIFTILSLLLYLGRTEFANVFNIPNFDKYLLAFFLFNYSNFIKILFETALKSLLFHRKIAHFTILNSLIRTVSYIVLLDKLDVNLLLYIEFILSILFTIQCLFYYRKYITTLDENTPVKTKTPVTSKRIKRFGLLSMVNELGSGVVGKTSDYFIVAAMSNPFQVGLFAFAHKLFSLVNHIVPIKEIMTVVRPMFFKKFSGDYVIEDFQKFYVLMIKILIPLYLFPALYFIIFGRHVIIYVFDPKYLEAYWVTVIVLLSNFVISFFYPVGLVVLLKEKMEYALYGKIVAFLSIFLGILGMKLFGLIGIALASLLGDFLKNVIIVFFMRNYKEIKINLFDFINFGYIILFCLPFYLFNFISIDNISFLGLSVVFGVFFLIMLIKLHPFSEYDLLFFESAFKSNSLYKKIKPLVLFINKSRLKI